MRPEGTTRWRKELAFRPEVWGPRLEALLKDGAARTLNRISVELVDFTADITAGTSLGEALWALVEVGAVEHTMTAPIFFRWLGPATASPDWGAALTRSIKGKETVVEEGRGYR